jgi:signal peptidase II
MALRAAAVAGCVVLVDQLTKLWVVAALPFGAERDIVPGLVRLVHTRNRGIAFGLLGNAGPMVHTLLLLAVVVTVAVLVHQLRRSHGAGFAWLGLALVLGGAVGNLVDRLARGEVVDFLDLFLRSAGRELHWPAFNVADAAITVGVGVIVLAELVGGRGDGRASSAR